jgi:hypothetical protein
MRYTDHDVVDVSDWQVARTITSKMLDAKDTREDSVYPRTWKTERLRSE